jgi:hypothetical protein
VKKLLGTVCLVGMAFIGCSSGTGDGDGDDDDGGSSGGGNAGSGQGGSGQGGSGQGGSGQGGSGQGCQLQDYDSCVTEAQSLTAETLACVQASPCELLAQGETVCGGGAGGSGAGGSGAGGSSGDACAQAGGARAPTLCPATCSSGGRCGNFQFPNCSALYGWCEHATLSECYVCAH